VLPGFVEGSLQTTKSGKHPGYVSRVNPWHEDGTIRLVALKQGAFCKSKP